MIEQLIPIWERVFKRSPISVHDNFFALGGNPPLAARLFAEIAHLCGQQLPPVAIYQAPSIATLAGLLGQNRSRRLWPLVLLKNGTEEPPIFMAHGLGSSVMEFFELVRHIELPRPIYGMQAKGMDGSEEPFERIEDMAEYYLGAIKTLQPHGPYHLIGYSLGGLVTLEMAQRLAKDGEKIARLVLLDAYPHPRYLSVVQRGYLAMRRARQHVLTLRKLPVREALSYVSGGPERRLRVSQKRSEISDQASIGVSPTLAMQRFHARAYLAWTRYRPKFYSGKMRFIKAAIRSDFPDDPAAVWTRLTAEFEVETVPGDHLGMLTTHFKSLASVLSRYF
jgi:acetoacetyl-CoA synthetase